MVPMVMALARTVACGVKPHRVALRAAVVLATLVMATPLSTVASPVDSASVRRPTRPRNAGRKCPPCMSRDVRSAPACGRIKVAACMPTTPFCGRVVVIRFRRFFRGAVRYVTGMPTRNLSNNARPRTASPAAHIASSHYWCMPPHGGEH